MPAYESVTVTGRRASHPKIKPGEEPPEATVGDGTPRFVARNLDVTTDAEAKEQAESLYTKIMEES